MRAPKRGEGEGSSGSLTARLAEEEFDAAWKANARNGVRGR
jgi:hypothetical protein